LIVDPNHSEAREQLARAETLLGEAEKAAEEQARLEAIRPIYNTAMEAFQAKRYEEAMRRFEEILEKDCLVFFSLPPGFPRAYLLSQAPFQGPIG